LNVLLIRRVFGAITNVMTWFGASIAHIVRVECAFTRCERIRLGLPELATSAALVIAFSLVRPTRPESASVLTSCASGTPGSPRQVISKLLALIIVLLLQLILILNRLII
jgi:hypothetical protein